MTTLLVALDGSDKDARALPVAAALAELSGADLRLVHVTGAPPDDAAARSEAAQRVATTAARFAPETPRRVTWEVCQDVDVAGTLIRLAAERDAAMLVMATRAATPLARAVMGSVADRVIRECPRPVALVPPGTAYMHGLRVRFTRVLVPLDGSALAMRALDLLLDLPCAGTLEYVLLQVVARAEDRARVRERLAAVAERLYERGASTVDIAVIDASDPADVIIAALREELIDLIAMSTRGQGGLRRLMFGSVAERVVRACEVPVLLLTPASLTDGSRSRREAEAVTATGRAG